MFIGAGFKILNKEEILKLNKEEILKRISEYDIFKYYIKSFVSINKTFSSELRNDRHPSCGIYCYNNHLYYKDFTSDKSLNVFEYLKTLFNCNYHTVLEMISNDFNLGLCPTKHIKHKPTMNHIGIKHNIVIKEKEKTKIQIKRRDWNNLDKYYWTQYGINRYLLNKYNVCPISSLWINDNKYNISKKSIVYAYVFGNMEYKILFPYNDKKFKWITNCNRNTLQGIKQLEAGIREQLIITSSLKDTILLSRFNIDAIAPNSENCIISEKAIFELKEKYKNIKIFFDNDEAGINNAKVYKDKYNIDSITIPVNNPKDISDYYKKWGYNPTKKLLDKLLNKEIINV